MNVPVASAPASAARASTSVIGAAAVALLAAPAAFAMPIETSNLNQAQVERTSGLRGTVPLTQTSSIPTDPSAVLENGFAWANTGGPRTLFTFSRGSTTPNLATARNTEADAADFAFPIGSGLQTANPNLKYPKAIDCYAVPCECGTSASLKAELDLKIAVPTGHMVAFIDFVTSSAQNDDRTGRHWAADPAPMG